MNHYIWIQSSKGISEQFWTGTSWTTILQFGKVYRFNDAIDIIGKRFHSKSPKPIIQSENYFIERERRRRRRARKAAKKQAKKQAKKYTKKEKENENQSD